MRTSQYFIHSLLSIIIAVGAIGIYHHYFYSAATIIESPKPSSMDVSLRSGYIDKIDYLLRSSSPSSFIDAAKTTTASVVYIMAYEKVGSSSFFTNDFKLEKGSGAIISSDGYIVTNYHVVKNANYISITLEDKREFEAEVIGYDELSDIALLKIEAADLSFLLFANSDSLQVGEWILAVGNPFGLQSTVTAGIVSAKGRNIDAINKNDVESLIQTDAVINPGSSGGALVNQNGLLVGICTAILSSTGNYEGLSFALPSNLVQKIIVDLKEFGAVQRGRLGITVQDINASIARKNNLSKIAGVQITSMNLNSSAIKAGLLKDDILLQINDADLNTTSDFYEQINKYRPGDRIRIKFHRRGETRELSILLTNHLNTTEYITVRNDKLLKDLGIEIRDLHTGEKARIKAQGVIVISVSKGSIIDQTNMEPGFIIEKINNIEVANATEFIALLKNMSDKVVLEGFYERYAGQFPYSFDLPAKK